MDLQVADELLVTQLELIIIIKDTERLRFSRTLVIKLFRALARATSRGSPVRR